MGLWELAQVCIEFSVQDLNGLRFWLALWELSQVFIGYSVHGRVCRCVRVYMRTDIA